MANNKENNKENKEFIPASFNWGIRTSTNSPKSIEK